MLQFARTLATLDLYEVPLSKPQPSGRLRTRAFLLLFVGSIAGYSAWLFITATPSAVQHNTAIHRLTDFTALTSYDPYCGCTSSAEPTFEPVALPPALQVEKILEWGTPPANLPPAGGEPPPRLRPRYLPYFSSPQHFCRRAYETKQACVLGTDSCSFEGAAARSFVLLVLEDVAYFCRKFANAIEQSLVAHSQELQAFVGGGMLSPSDFNSSADDRQQLFATSLFYNTRDIAAELQHYGNSVEMVALDASAGARERQPPGCVCIGANATVALCESFVPWWAPAGAAWPRLTCNPHADSALRVPVNFLFNGTWWTGALRALNMSAQFIATFGSGAMEPAVYAGDASQTVSLYVAVVGILTDSVPDFELANKSGNLIYNAPSLLRPDYGAFYDACLPDTCTYVTYEAPFFVIIVQVAVASGSLFNVFYQLLRVVPCGDGGDEKGGTNDGGVPLEMRQLRVNEGGYTLVE